MFFFFHESFFPFHINQNLFTSETQPNSHIDPISHTPPQFTPSTPITTNIEPTISQPNGLPSPLPNPSSPHKTDTPNPNIINQYTQEPSSNHALPRRSNRDTHPPSYLSDYQFQIPSLKSAQSSSTCTYPIQSFLSYTHVSPSHHHFLMTLSSEHEPTSFHEAVKHQCWCDAMKCEIKVLQLNQT